MTEGSPELRSCRFPFCNTPHWNEKLCTSQIMIIMSNIINDITFCYFINKRQKNGWAYGLKYTPVMNDENWICHYLDERKRFWTMETFELNMPGSCRASVSHPSVGSLEKQTFSLYFVKERPVLWIDVCFDYFYNETF